ncbi:MAG: SGNH/GDSL hydrolase family protein [Clostridiales bacterium]|nr:SGNH/GDSL hydrolase family protein [Clostridiales bacterium]
MKRVLQSIAILLAFFALLFAAQRLVTPKYMSDVYEGAMTKEYYGAPKQNELLILGDCEAYDNWSPVTLYNEFGITSYIRGGPELRVWQAYYLLKDTLRYEKPRAVLLNIRMMHNGENEEGQEPYNRLNLDGMRPSWDKWQAVQASMTEGESTLSYLFPLLRYHERWRELSAEDFQYFFRTEKVSFNGYFLRADTKPATVFPVGPKLADYRFSDLAWDYLERIRLLCEAEDIVLILAKPPTIWPYWYVQWEEQIADYAARHDLAYYNLLEDLEAAGIDWETDSYDAGLHLNVFGAEKCARYLGARLQAEFSFTDYRRNPAIAAYWDALTREYAALKAKQLSELAESGTIQTYTHGGG